MSHDVLKDNSLFGFLVQFDVPQDFIVLQEIFPIKYTQTPALKFVN